MNRKEKITRNIDYKKSVGLEIGALSSPVLSKDEASIYYADHMSTEDLKKKYKSEPVILDDIVEVDYAIAGLTLRESITDNKFDYVIASHVIEHVPDMIRWLDDIATILKKDGVLSLVIPDKRFTFDITRKDSTIANVIGAYIDKHKRTDSATMYDYLTEYRNKIIASEINANELKDFSFKPRRYSDDDAWDLTMTNSTGKEYVDSHCYVFTPHSFFEIIKKLTSLNLIKFEVLDFIDTSPGELEFYVTLKKTNKKNASDKLSLVPRIKKEMTKKELMKQINSYKKKNSELQNQNENFQKMYNNLLHSKSWKITSPLRKFVALFKK